MLHNTNLFVLCAFLATHFWVPKPRIPRNLFAGKTILSPAYQKVEKGPQMSKLCGRILHNLAEGELELEMGKAARA